MPFIKFIAKLLSFVTYIATLCAAFGGYIDPHIWALPAILTLALPWLTILSGILIVIWLANRSWITATLGILTIFISLSPLSQAFPIASSKKEKKGQRTFSLITFNIMHADDRKNPTATNNRALKWLIQQDADIVVLQELFSFDDPAEVPAFSPELRDSLFRAYPYYGSDRSTDRTILSKFDVTTRYDWMKIDPNHRLHYDIFTVDIYGHKLNIIDTHLTSYQLKKQETGVIKDLVNVRESKEGLKLFKSSVKTKLGEAFRQRAEVAAKLRLLINEIPDPLIVCGDFNDVPASWTYRIIKGDDLKDAYSETGFGHIITYNDNLMFFHIDQILYRGNLQALSVTKGDIDTSDHFPLIARFSFTAPPQN